MDIERWYAAQKAELVFWKSQKTIKKEWKIIKMRYGKIVSEIKKEYKINSNSKILDVGCGPKPFSLLFNTGMLYGIDPLASYFKKFLPKKFNIKRGIGESLPWRDSFFNIVVCRNVLDHTQNPKKVIKEIKRVLKPGGILILSVYIYGPFIKFVKKIVEKLNLPYKEIQHPHFFTKAEILKLCKLNNFRNKKEEIMSEDFPSSHILWKIVCLLDKIFGGCGKRQDYFIIAENTKLS